MRIAKIKLVNWKNFTSAEAELPHRVFIVGPNASGKSNFLDAIRFLRDIVRQGGGLQEAVGLRGGLSKIRCIAARKNTDVGISISVHNEQNKPVWEYELIFNQTGGGISELKPVVKKEYLKDLVKSKTLINRPGSKKESEYQLGFTLLEQASINERFKEFVNFLGEVAYLHLIPQLIREPKSFLKTTKGEDYYGRDFLERIRQLNQKTSRSYIAKIQSVLQFALPHLEELSFNADELGVPHFEAIFKHWRAYGAKHQELQFSDGTLRLIGLLWALQDGTKPLLLEEPELSLHSAIIMRLPDIIYQLQKKKNSTRQVIVTTHSHEILNNRGVAPEEILLIETQGGEGSTIRAAAKLPEVQAYLQNGEMLGDLIMGKTAPSEIHHLNALE